VFLAGRHAQSSQGGVPSVTKTLGPRIEYEKHQPILYGDQTIREENIYTVNQEC